MGNFGLRREGNDINSRFVRGVEKLFRSPSIDDDVFRTKSFDRLIDEALKENTIVGIDEVSKGSHCDARFGWEAIERVEESARVGWPKVGNALSAEPFVKASE